MEGGALGRRSVGCDGVSAHVLRASRTARALGAPGKRRDGPRHLCLACVPCHGVAGKGDGSVGPMLAPRRAPQPRDFTSAEFKFRSTPSGQLPTTADLFRTLTEGVRSSGGPLTIGLRGHRIMPSFQHMPVAQRLEVLEYVKSLNRGFWERGAVKTVTVPAAPTLTPERLARGKKLYADAECR